MTDFLLVLLGCLVSAVLGYGIGYVRGSTDEFNSRRK